MGCAIALVIGFGVLSLWQLQAVNNVTEEIRSVRLPQLETVELIKRLASEHKLLATRRTQTTNFHHLAAIGAGMEETEKALADAVASYRSAAGDLHEAGLIEEFNTLWDIYRRSLVSVMGKLEVGEISAAHQEFSSNSTAILDKAAAALDGLLSSSKQKSQLAAARARDVYSRAFLLTIAQIAGIALFALAAFLWMSRNVTRPIVQVSRAMQALTAGDDQVELVSRGRRSDEIGVLFDAVAGYRDALGRSREFAAQAELVRNRLQAAVTNMPVGLCMFDNLHRLITSNDAYRELYGIPAELTAPGTTLNEIFRRRADDGLLPRRPSTSTRRPSWRRSPPSSAVSGWSSCRTAAPSASWSSRSATAAGFRCTRTSPNAAAPRNGSPTWRGTTRSPVCPTGLRSRTILPMPAGAPRATAARRSCVSTSTASRA